MNLYELTIKQAHKLLKNKEITSQELTKSILDRISQIENKINAFITVNYDLALEQAKQADKLIAENAQTISFLTGIPLSIKDVICVAGVKTTCGSKILENFISPYDAFVIKKLKSQNAVIIGKTNMDEFAMGSSTENSAFKTTKNPWDLTKIPGGSSGGSAASVAASMCLGSLGSDTGGSIRQPASHCGVVGFKPTYGRVSRYGLVAFASSLDQIGPITKNIEDCAILTQAISGHDKKDSTSIPKEVPNFMDSLKLDGLKGLTIGIPIEYNSKEAQEGIDKDVLEAFKNSVEKIKSLGAKCIDISLPHTKYCVSVYYVIAPCEASSNLARFDGAKYGLRVPKQDLIGMYKATRSQGFGAEVQRRIIIGTYCLSSGYYDAYYKKASQVRTLIKQDFKDAFEITKCNAILSPVTPTPAFSIGEKIDDPLKMYLSDIFTISANLAGIPGMSVPCGFSKNNLPIGLQILANHFDEEIIFKIAYNFEQSTAFHKSQPALSMLKNIEISKSQSPLPKDRGLSREIQEYLVVYTKALA